MTYTEMIQKLDSKNSYSNYNTKPVKRLNAVWEVVININHRVVINKIYKSTDKAAEQEAYKYIENYKKNLESRNIRIREKYEKMNAYMLRDDPNTDAFWLYSEQDIEEAQNRIETIVINVTDKEGNKKVITL